MELVGEKIAIEHSKTSCNPSKRFDVCRGFSTIALKSGRAYQSILEIEDDTLSFGTPIDESSVFIYIKGCFINSKYSIKRI